MSISLHRQTPRKGQGAYVIGIHFEDHLHGSASGVLDAYSAIVVKCFRPDSLTVARLFARWYLASGGAPFIASTGYSPGNPNWAISFPGYRPTASLELINIRSRVPQFGS